MLARVCAAQVARNIVRALHIPAEHTQVVAPKKKTAKARKKKDRSR